MKKANPFCTIFHYGHNQQILRKIDNYEPVQGSKKNIQNIYCLFTFIYIQ